jgi:hypothetical protein
LGQGNRELLTGNRNRVLSDFTFLHIPYTSPLDALVAVAKRLTICENQQKMDSEEFFYQYNPGR